VSFRSKACFVLRCIKNFELNLEIFLVVICAFSPTNTSSYKNGVEVRFLVLDHWVQV